MPNAKRFDFRLDRLPQAGNGGLFISRGQGRHPRRTIQSWELIFVRSGSLGIQEDDARFDLNANEYLVLQPGCTHDGTRDYAADLSFYWVHFNGLFVHSKTRKNAATLHQHGSPRRPGRVIQLLHEFLEDQESPSPSQVCANCLLMLMLHEVSNSLAESPPASGKLNSLAAHAQHYLRAHANQTISTHDIAAHLGCNPDYLGRVFRETYGISIVTALTQQRISDAKKILLDNELNIDQVAQACGFATTSYFRRVFKQYTGVSPNLYRNMHLRLHINWR